MSVLTRIARLEKDIDVFQHRGPPTKRIVYITDQQQPTVITHPQPQPRILVPPTSTDTENRIELAFKWSPRETEDELRTRCHSIGWLTKRDPDDLLLRMWKPIAN